jgi:hypothetical protein
VKDNPFVKNFPEFDSAAWNSVEVTNSNGVFRIVAIPGRVLLMGGPRATTGDFKYKPSVVDPKYRQYFREAGANVAFYGLGGGWSPILDVYFKVLEIKPDAKVFEHNIILERAPALTVQIQDAEGKPLGGVYVAGIRSQGHWPTYCSESTCSAYGIQPGSSRLMLFYHRARNLAGAIALKGGEKQPATVKLGPMGTLKGRLLVADGKPLAGVRVDLRFHHLDADTMRRLIYEDKQIVTDAKGSFTHENVIPGFEFELSFRRGRQRFEREAKPVEAVIQVKPGEHHDVGDLQLQPKE